MKVKNTNGPSGSPWSVADDDRSFSGSETEVFSAKTNERAGPETARWVIIPESLL